MLAELGQITLLSALLVSLVLGTLPLLGAARKDATLMALATPGAVLQAALVIAAYALLTWAFVVQDFSVEYVALHSNTQLPLVYRLTAVWSAMQ